MTTTRQWAFLAALMLRFTKTWALLLAILWVPASVHCAMDRADWFEIAPSCCNGKADPAKSDTSSECCAMLDSVMPRLTTTDIKAPSLIGSMALPWVAWPDCEFVLRPLVSLEVTIGPPELSTTWQFLDRAALPLRAPPVVC